MTSTQRSRHGNPDSERGPHNEAQSLRRTLTEGEWEWTCCMSRMSRRVDAPLNLHVGASRAETPVYDLAAI